MVKIADDSKTEKATPRKREDERKKGNLFQSADIASALSLLLIFMFLRAAGPYYFNYIKKILTDYFTSFSGVTDFGSDASKIYLNDFAIKCAVLILPAALFTVAVSIALTGAQTRFKVAFKMAGPKLSRINPISGFKKMFSGKTLIELLKSSIKIVIVGYILYSEIKSLMGNFLIMSDTGVNESFFWVCQTIYDIAVRIGLFMTGLGIFDYFYQWWDHERQLMMTKQEVKDEFKRTEGDPQVRGRIRNLQRKMASARMMQKVPSADVVVRNPTHFAVALKYDPKADRAPVVIAKGADYVAFKIIEVAEKNKVTVLENRPLARGLYEAVEIGQVIPEEFYQAVADVLAFVFSLRDKSKTRRNA